MIERYSTPEMVELWSDKTKYNIIKEKFDVTRDNLTKLLETMKETMPDDAYDKAKKDVLANMEIVKNNMKDLAKLVAPKEVIIKQEVKKDGAIEQDTK